MKKVLFVCMGNICRSPAGEAVMRQFAENDQIDIEVDSAGTHGYHIGNKADARMRAAASKRGYEVTSLARQVTKADLDGRSFDLVLAMDRENQNNLQRLAGKVSPHIRLFSDYLDGAWPRDVPDPYYGGPEGFETVLDMLEAGCPLILKTLVEDPSGA